MRRASGGSRLRVVVALVACVTVAGCGGSTLGPDAVMTGTYRWTTVEDAPLPATEYSDNSVTFVALSGSLEFGSDGQVRRTDVVHAVCGGCGVGGAPVDSVITVVVNARYTRNASQLSIAYDQYKTGFPAHTDTGTLDGATLHMNTLVVSSPTTTHRLMGYVKS